MTACARSQTLDLTLEQQAQAIDRTVLCPVCPGETIDQSQAQVARDMRGIVREKLTAGETREAILAFFVARYGPGVLAEPPRSGAHLVAWLVPPLMVAAALVALFFVVRAMRVAPRPSKTAASAAGDLTPYLKAVDTELGES